MHRVIVDAEGRPLFAVEVEASDDILRGADAAAEAAENIRVVGDAIARSCTDIFSAVRDAASEALPDELELSFGVTLGGEAGLPWIKASGESTFAVTARWKVDR